MSFDHVDGIIIFGAYKVKMIKSPTKNTIAHIKQTTIVPPSTETFVEIALNKTIEGDFCFNPNWIALT